MTPSSVGDRSAAYRSLRRVSKSAQAVRLTDGDIRALIFVTARDLGVAHLVDGASEAPGDFFALDLSDRRTGDGADPRPLYEQLLTANPAAETYLDCLGAIHRARLKYRHVVKTQPLPTVDQVATRSLLQYGTVDRESLRGLLAWRKWLFDLDNRAAQETGYLFERVVAGVLGGTRRSSSKSPIKRANRPGNRQVDCLKDTLAYEIKIRLTIAASGQGRWSEELSFPAEAQRSGFEPRLVVLDPTPNPKLAELVDAFAAARGSAYLGADVWAHLAREAGPEMAIFLENYVRRPLADVSTALADPLGLPDFGVRQEAGSMRFRVGRHEWRSGRGTPDRFAADDPLPDA
ncbi:MAG: hypothetical protein FWF28_08085 [Micrococcales bacterium]|nr:hypothetical protein [Micrococcales bacterium]